VVEGDIVCTLGHVKYETNFRLEGEDRSQISPDLWALTGPLRVLTLRLESSPAGEDATTYEGKGDFGLKDQWGEGPGMFTLGLSLRFPHQGSEALDRGFIENHLGPDGWLNAVFYDHNR
jgi:hypothetical protein